MVVGLEGIEFVFRVDFSSFRLELFFCSLFLVSSSSVDKVNFGSREEEVWCLGSIFECSEGS